MYYPDPTLAPYAGELPYIFLSYSHKDGDGARSIIEKLKEFGFRVWYDENLNAASEYAQILAKKVKDCGFFIALMSPDFVESPFCNDELHYALSNNKPILVVYLRKTVLPDWMDMRLGRYQALFLYTDGDRIYDKLLAAEGIDRCREADALQTPPTPEAPPPEAPPKTPPKWLKPVLLAGAAVVLVLAVLLAAGVFRHREKPEPEGMAPTAAPEATPEQIAAVETAVPAYSAALPDDHFEYADSFESLEAYYAAAEQHPAFGLSVSRSEVQSITFLPNTDSKPSDARDLSETEDGSVWAWVERRGQLYALTVAADGGMRMPETINGFFAGYVNLEEINWNDAVSFAEVKSAKFLFSDCKSLTALALTGAASFHPGNLRGAFCTCESLETLDLSGLHTEENTDFGYLFRDCSSLKDLILDPEAFRTDSGEYMRCMFYGCAALRSLDLSFFRTNKVKDMSYMFSGCAGLTELDLTAFRTNKVTNMCRMFNECSGLVSLTLDPEGFITDNVTDMQGMFRCCSALTSLDISFFHTANVTDMSWLFSRCSCLRSILWDPETFRTDKVQTMRFMFYDCAGLTSLDLSCFNTAKTADMGCMFSGCSGLVSLTLDPEGFVTDNVTDMESMFYNCSGLTELDLSSFHTENVTDMDWMFSKCSSLRTLVLDPETFRTDKVGTGSDPEDPGSLQYMFGVSRLPDGLSLSFAGMDKAEITKQMFCSCTGARTLTLSGPVYLGEKMFADSSLEELHLLGRITGAAVNAFAGCTLKVYYNGFLKDPLANLPEEDLEGTVEWIPEYPLLEATPVIDGTEGANLFDGKAGTNWRVAFDGSAAVTWYEPEARPVTGISLEYTIREEADVGMLPAQWKLYGKSEAEGEWRLIYTRDSTWNVNGDGDRSLRIPLVTRNSEGGYVPYAQLRRYRYFSLVITDIFDPEAGILQFSGFVLQDDEADYTERTADPS